jgi:hypothetical protein
MAKKGGRGSEKMFASLAKGQAKNLQSALSGWKLTDWFPLGKPNPEVITAGVGGNPGRLGSLIGKLTKIKEIREIEILINGQPRPDIAQVRFQIRAGRR